MGRSHPHAGPARRGLAAATAASKSERPKWERPKWETNRQASAAALDEFGSALCGDEALLARVAQFHGESLVRPLCRVSEG